MASIAPPPFPPLQARLAWSVRHIWQNTWGSEGRKLCWNTLPARKQWRNPYPYGTIPYSLFSPAFPMLWVWEMCGGFHTYVRCTEEVSVVYIFLLPSKRSGARFKSKSMLSMLMLCSPSKVQGRVGGLAFCWCTIYFIVALFYIFFSIRLLPDSCPNIVAFVSCKCSETVGRPVFSKKMEVKWEIQIHRVFIYYIFVPLNHSERVRNWFMSLYLHPWGLGKYWEGEIITLI